MPLRRLAAITVLGLGVASAPLSANVLASAGSNHPQGLTVTAARPGIELVAPGPGHISPQADHAVRRALTTGEGAGSGFCRAHKGYALGASLDGVFACGPSTGTADDFDSVGFQCVELSERYLWVVYQDFIPDVPSGKELVSMGHQSSVCLLASRPQASFPPPVMSSAFGADRRPSLTDTPPWSAR